jgi:hypothetical protein
MGLFSLTPVTDLEPSSNGVTVMSQRLKVQEMVMQMHEKNLVLTNLLRDIVENETSDIISRADTEEEFCRAMNDRAARRLELVAEIEDFLRREDAARRVSA